MPLPERLVAEYFAAPDPLLRCGAFRNRGLAQRQCRGPESLPITAGATWRAWNLPSLDALQGGVSILERWKMYRRKMRSERERSIRPRNLCASFAHHRPAFGAASNLLKGSTHFGDSRMIASPRTNVKRRPYGRGGGVGRGRGEGVALGPAVAVGVAVALGVAVGVGLPCVQLKISIEASGVNPSTS